MKKTDRLAQHGTVHLIFKSGAEVSFDALKVTTDKNPDGVLDSLKWTTPDGAKLQLAYASLSSIDAVVFAEP